MKKKYLSIPLAITLTCSLSACLKTRAQLKAESDEQPAPIQAQVEDVQPQGKYAIDEIKSEITRLTGRIEDLEQKDKDTAAPDQPTKDDLNKLEKRIVELEQAQIAMLEAIKKTQAALPVPDQPELFDKAKADFKEKNYEKAIESVNAYLKNPNAKHSEEALFLRAECYFALKQYKKAIVDYSKFPEKYTKSKRLADALFKIGQSFEALGMKEDAKSFYLELADKFPKSQLTKKVKNKLK